MSLKEEILKQTQRDHKITGETFELFVSGSAVEQRAFLEQEVELARNMILFGGYRLLLSKIGIEVSGVKEEEVVVEDIDTTEAPLYVKDGGAEAPSPTVVGKTKKGVDKTI